ncbi:MAG: hypothetical protein WA634_10700 [Silvibacterium sp.]
MTTVLAPMNGVSALISPTRSNARSEPADRLVEMQEQIREQMLKSYSIRSRVDQARADIEAVQQEASFDGWDGYGGKALDAEACVITASFLEALPTTIPIPEISADNDGEVALDWIFAPRRALTISIDGRGRCSYAWMLGQITSRGTDWITDGIPANIAYALAQLTS